MTSGQDVNPLPNGPPPTLVEVLTGHGATGEGSEELLAALTERENNMADIFRLAGMQFGLMPFIVSEVLAQAGLGTPPSEEERELIRRAYIAGMEELRRQHGQ